MTKAKNSEASVWHLIDMFNGDKIILMILLILYVCSILVISSSTPLLAIQQHTTRMAIIKEQFVVVMLGLGLVGLIFLLVKYGGIGLIRILSQLGFFVSLAMLVFLVFNGHMPGIEATTINGARRAIKIGGFQLHVSEFVKVFMIMYLAWAINAFHKHEFMLANILAENPRFSFLSQPRWQILFYLYLPVIITSLLLLVGSASSCLFIGGIMFAIILIGGINWRDILLYVSITVMLLGLATAISFGTDGKVFPRIKTAAGRIERATSGNVEDTLAALPKNSQAFRELLDVNLQPISAKVAVSEGGLFGKGPGKSTQRYVVPVMFEDYVFSFIVEEYGIIGAILVMILYGSLLARGALLVKNCDNEFAKLAVAGLVILIVGQAAMHMMINVDLGPLTGQTLPLISHGNSSFLAFSIAFGILLAISTLAKQKLDRETAKAAPIMAESSPETTDDTKARLDALEDLDD